MPFYFQHVRSDAAISILRCVIFDGESVFYVGMVVGLQSALNSSCKQARYLTVAKLKVKRQLLPNVPFYLLRTLKVQGKVQGLKLGTITLWSVSPSKERFLKYRISRV